MKKIYLSLATLATCISAQSQNAISIKASNNNPAHVIANPHPSKITSTSKTAAPGGHITRGILAEEIINLKGYTQAVEFQVYANSVYVDSTVVTTSSSGTSNVFNIKAGATFDPVSFYWGQGNQLLSSADAYTVDSLWVGARYERINHTVVDTLLVEFVWGPSNSTTVWQALTINSSTPAINAITPKANTSSAHGTTLLNAPAANYKRIKYPLLDADTNRLTNGGYIIIPNVNQLVPAGNVFAASYSFIPGQAVAAGSVVHMYSGGTPQTTNGLLGFLYSDPSANPTQNYFDDNSSLSVGLDYTTRQRYAKYTGTLAFLNTCMLPNLDGGWDMGFSVTYASSSVGVNELERKGFVLGQNTPNPFNGESKVSYMLSKDAKSAVFTVTDVMGRMISTENVETTTGTHSVKLSSYPAGIYYYSLNVDGNVTTNKMIAQ